MKKVDYNLDFPKHTVIQDECLGNYFIVDDGYCFAVYVVEEYDPNEKRGRAFRTKDNKMKKPKALTFHPNLGRALDAISRNLIYDKQKRFTVKEYVNQLEDIKEQILNIES
jgi:hypothetical protein